MRLATERTVNLGWCDLLGVAAAELWQRTTVRPHGELDDYPGWYVAWRDDGLHVSAPSTARADEVASLEQERLASIASGAFWADFAQRRGLVLRGPAMHSYLDDDPGRSPDVVDLTPGDLDPIRAEVTEQEWDDWHTEDPVHPVGIVEDGRVVAAASLGAWRGVARDIGVVVVADRRGRGLAARVGVGCASYAVREHGFAIWRAALANRASVRTAERLGFERSCTQLAVRPG